jgi:hypothetical protein
MRGHTNNITGHTRFAWRTLLSLAAVGGALALPAAASARPVDSGPYVAPASHTAVASHVTVGRPNEGTYVATTTLRRDGSQAVPFVANVGEPTPSAPSAQSDTFDWGDAGIGAAAAFGLTVLAGGALAIRRRTHLEPSTS